MRPGYIAGFAAVIAGLVAASTANAQDGLWEGSWLSRSSSLEDNLYEILTISNIDADGFTYSFECRSVPYGPNARSTAEARATFRGPSSAQDQTSGQTFSLAVDPDDRHDRVIAASLERSYDGLFCSPSGEGASDEFVFQRPVYRAGFDCGQAATPVENAICGNELIALGDRSMTMAYRALMGAFSNEDRQSLRASQRAWLRERNRACASAGTVDDICLARLYAHRLAALGKLLDPGLGGEPRFDASFAVALLNRGVDLRQDIAVRLALYPLEMDRMGTTAWQADESGLLFEQTYTKERSLFPANVEFRYSDMLFVASDGAVWTAAHTEPLLSAAQFDEHNPYQLWGAAGRDPFTFRSDTGIESSDVPAPTDRLPNLVRCWLDRHPVSELMRLP
ncbi:MAG: lysozyme inhibitor LprI family protein [Rhodospirillaceae bacterium]|nr:lysozyme inhibitor LprI family protein [Rhodospirillaceae bacterium]